MPGEGEGGKGPFGHYQGQETTWYLKVSFRIRRETHGFSVSPPLCTVSTWKIVSGPLCAISVDRRTFCHILCPFIPGLVAMEGLVCCGLTLEAVSLMLAREAEDVRGRGRLLGLSSFLCIILGLGAWTAPASESCGPHPLASEPSTVSFLVPSSPPHQQSQPSPYLWVVGWAPKQHRPLFPLPLPQRDMTFFLDCLY